jgi:hypothetical protein
MITNYARCTHEIKSRLVMANAAFNKKTFPEQLRLKFMEELVKCYIWGMGLYGVETLTLWKIRNTLKVLKLVAGEGWRRPVGPHM